MDCTRRGFFGQFGRSLANDLADAVEALRSTRSAGGRLAPASPQRREWLRPPGAKPESEFLATCTRCTACQEVCPYQSIRRLGPEHGAASGTPAIIPSESPCYLCEDMPCIAACEPKALVLISRHEVGMGLAEINESTCYAAQGQPCDYCVTRCPLRSAAIGFDERGIPRVVTSGCTGCGVCAYLCPAQSVAVAPN